MRPSLRSTGPALAVALALALAACGGTGTPAPSGQSAAPSSSSGGTATGGTVRIGIGGAPDSLNPGNGLLSEAYTLYELVYDTPISITSAGEYVPELATDWSPSDDGLTWTMTIRDDVTFHDGEPLTAEDVAYSIQLYKDTEDFPYLPSYASYFDTIEAPDPTHVVLTTTDPLGNFEANMVFMYVLPKHIWENVDDPVAFQNEEMIGSGAFKLVENVQGESTTLAANEDYWNGRPNVDQVIFQTISNADARVTALTNGDVDAITEFPATAVPALNNADGVTVHIADIGAGGDIRDVFFNVVDPANCPTDDPETDEDESGVCSGHPALQDKAVRQALAMAMDKQQIIDVALLGLGSPGVALVPPGLGDFYLGEGSDNGFDVDAANQLLDDAGYKDTNGDGVRECLPDQDCPTGDLTLRFNYADDIDTAAREADLIAGMWEQIGVKIDIQGLDADTLTSVCCPSFDYDVILWGWGADPDPAFLLGVAICDEISTGFSETGYCNPQYDDLYSQQGVETDHATRVEIIHQMQQILVDDVPYIIPYYQQTRQAWRSDKFIGWLEDDPTLGLEAPDNLTVISQAQ
jgi:peptide/nickel transport system substrate-binding protein